MAKKSKLNLINDDLTWNADRRYKVNSVVQLKGVDYQNITGKNSQPDLLVDWQKSISDLSILETYTENSAGALSGFLLTDNGNGTVNISSGVALLRSIDQETGLLSKYTIPAATNLALTDNANNYVLANYNGGSPSLTVTTDPAVINTTTNTLVWLIARVGNKIDRVYVGGQNVDSNGKLRRRFLNSEPIFRAQGAALSFTNRALSVSGGLFYLGLTPYGTPTLGATFTNVYNNASVWTRQTAQSQVNNTQYNVNGVLTAMNNGRFRVDYVYLLVNSPSQVYTVMGGSQYNNLAEARLAPLPSTLPVELQRLGVLVGRLIIEKDATAITEVSSAYDIRFNASTVINHNDTGGIQGGAVGDYQHVTTAEKTDWNGKVSQDILTTSDKTNKNILVGFKKSSDDALNNYEFSMAKLADGTIVRAGVYSTDRYEQVFGAYVGFSKSTDEGVTWSSVTNVYTSVGETVELPTLVVIGSRISIVFRTTTGGANTYTNGVARTAYSNDGGATWTNGVNIVSPSSIVLLPYGRIDQYGDSSYIALMHNINYCEAWGTNDGINWNFRNVVYDYRSSPLNGTSILIEPNSIYIGANKSIILARNNGGSPAYQFVSSDNLASVSFSGISNLNDGIEITNRFYNPVALLSDNTNRILYAALSTRNTDIATQTPNKVLLFVSDLDEVFASATAHRLKFNADKPMPNGNSYNKGYHSLVKVSYGILGNFTETSVNYKYTSNFATSKINNSYSYSLALTDKPFDFKNIQNQYPNSIQTKNIYTGNYDYLTTPNLFELDPEKNIQSRHNSTWTFVNNTSDVNNAIAVFAGAIKFFELYRNRAVFNVPISSAASVNTVAGEELISRFFGFDAASLAVSAFKASSVTQYMLLKSTSSKPLALGTTSTPTALYINNDGSIKLNAATAGLSWFDFQASTALKSSLLIPTGSAPTTPANGSIWRPSASVLNFYDGSNTRQLAFTDNPTFTGSVKVPIATLSTEAVSKGQLDAVATSGTYTPTLTAGANITGLTLNSVFYTKVGNVVTSRVTVTFSTTSGNTVSSFNFTLPINKTGTTSISLGNGTSITGASVSNSVDVLSTASNNTATASFISGAGSGVNGKATVYIMYDITQ